MGCRIAYLCKHPTRLTLESKCAEQWSSTLTMHQSHLEREAGVVIRGLPSPHFHLWGQDLRTFISNKLPGDVDAAYLGATFWETQA